MLNQKKGIMEKQSVSSLNLPESNLPRVVIIGGGFAGLEFVKHTDHNMFQVVMLDRNNYHTFQPLLYQVATGGLEPDSIAFPLRKYMKRFKNSYFRYAEVQSVDTERQEVITSNGRLHYDRLVIATGSRPNFFNNPNLENNTMPLKQVTHALNLRSLLLQNLEQAVFTTDEKERESLLTIVISGAGPTGVELAGALSELKRYVFKDEYDGLNVDHMKIILIEGEGEVLPPMSEHASRKSLEALRNMGVDVRLNTRIEDYQNNQVKTRDGDTITTKNMIWTAGVMGNPIDGISKDVMARGNRIRVDRFSAVEGTKNIFAVGDVAAMISDAHPRGYPMMAQPAIQQGRTLAKNLKRQQEGKQMKAFEYHDKGSMATIGRSKAVVDLKNYKFAGFPAWIVWLMVHLISLVGFENKVVVFFDWFFNYMNFNSALRLIIRPYKRNEKKRENTD